MSLPRRLTLKAGALLFDEGEVADAAFLILAGTVELFTLKDGVRLPAGRRGANDLAGEEALLDPRPRATAAVAVTDCELLVVTREQLSLRFEAIDPLLRFCLGALLDRLGPAPAMLPEAPRPPRGSMWSGHVAAARAVLSLEHELRSGLDRNEFAVHFQPIVDLASRRLAGFEALVRWQHPVRGLLQPNDFIPLAETSGTIGAVTTFCLRNVAACFPALREAASRNPCAERLFLSVNVSGSDLLRPAFAAETVSILEEGGVAPEDVRLEITESILLADAERCAQTLSQCRDHGFKIAIDDFGTGYSSLNYLHTLPVSVLKIDRSFILSLLDGSAGRKIVAAILDLGRELGLTVIAEGIEDERQAELLAAMGCPFGQGYLFGRALDQPETLALIGAWRAGRDAAPRRVARG